MNTGGRGNPLARPGQQVNAGYYGAPQAMMALGHAAVARASAHHAKSALRSALTALIAQHLAGQMSGPAAVGPMQPQPQAPMTPAAISPLLAGRAAPARRPPGVADFTQRFARNRRVQRGGYRAYPGQAGLGPYTNF